VKIFHPSAHCLHRSHRSGPRVIHARFFFFVQISERKELIIVFLRYTPLCTRPIIIINIVIITYNVVRSKTFYSFSLRKSFIVRVTFRISSHNYSRSDSTALGAFRITYALLWFTPHDPSSVYTSIIILYCASRVCTTRVVIEVSNCWKVYEKPRDDRLLETTATKKRTHVASWTYHCF
jgi:hypothetical protein